MARPAWLAPIASAVLVFLVGYLLWPPNNVYWVAVADVVGGGIVWLAIVGSCIGVGYAVRRFTPISPLTFTLGGIAAYLVGMYLISATMTPDSPVHFFMYGFMLGCMVFGTVADRSLDAVRVVLDRATSPRSDQ